VSSAFGKSRLLIGGNLAAQAEKSVNSSEILWFYSEMAERRRAWCVFSNTEGTEDTEFEGKTA
jgi:hypothetical protein